jgi:hypothetical protein
MLQIPISAIPWQVFNVVLDGQKCKISLRQIAQSLYCDLICDDQTIFVGRICEDGTPINCYPSRYFRGNLVFYDTKGNEHPQYEGLNDRWILTYTAENE